MLEDIEPRNDLVLNNGDVVVLLGQSDDIKDFERYSRSGIQK
jgi:CPA2 family monovalent cation:H+ antiporter-2